MERQLRIRLLKLLRWSGRSEAKLREEFDAFVEEALGQVPSKRPYVAEVADVLQAFCTDRPLARALTAEYERRRLPTHND